MTRNIALYRWHVFFNSLMFWQAVWFLVFQERLSAAEAILLYVAFDIATTALEVPSGYLSDRIGRRVTLILSGLAGVAGAVLFWQADVFWVAVAAKALMGVSKAFASGTDSSVLYESLAAEGRTAEIEAQELTAWRYGFTAFALSAVTGGAMAMMSPQLPFIASALAACGVLAVALAFREPPHKRSTGGTLAHLAAVARSFRAPALRWLFGLAVMMFAFSHIPFIFGQPFILEALDGVGLAGEAPWVSGAVTSIMMLISLGTSLIAPRLRRKLGLSGILLLAFGMQVSLTGVLTLTNSVLAIAFLFLRLVPESFAKPFVVARIQRELSDEARATYLSVQSFTARLMFASALFFLSLVAPDTDSLAYEDLQIILGVFFAAGLTGFLILAATASRAGLDRAPSAA